MTTTIQEDALADLWLESTSEPRLRVLRVCLKQSPTTADVERISDVLNAFCETYEGRLVGHMTFAGDLIKTSKQIVITLIGRLMNAGTNVNRVLKGFVIEPRTMDSNVAVLKTLFVTMYPTRRAFNVVTDPRKSQRFIERLVARERYKREKKPVVGSWTLPGLGRRGCGGSSGYSVNRRV